MGKKAKKHGNMDGTSAAQASFLDQLRERNKARAKRQRHNDPSKRRGR